MILYNKCCMLSLFLIWIIVFNWLKITNELPYLWHQIPNIRQVWKLKFVNNRWKKRRDKITAINLFCLAKFKELVCESRISQWTNFNLVDIQEWFIAFYEFFIAIVIVNAELVGELSSCHTNK